MTPEEFLVEVEKLHRACGELVSRSVDELPATVSSGMAVGSLVSCELILENLVKAGPPLDDPPFPQLRLAGTWAARG